MRILTLCQVAPDSAPMRHEAPRTFACLRLSEGQNGIMIMMILFFLLSSIRTVLDYCRFFDVDTKKVGTRTPSLTDLPPPLFSALFPPFLTPHTPHAPFSLFGSKHLRGFNQKLQAITISIYICKPLFVSFGAQPIELRRRVSIETRRSVRRGASQRDAGWTTGLPAFSPSDFWALRGSSVLCLFWGLSVHLFGRSRCFVCGSVWHWEGLWVRLLGLVGWPSFPSGCSLFCPRVNSELVSRSGLPRDFPTGGRSGAAADWAG